jgi:hypothetical protein
MNRASMIGLRINWVCAECPKSDNTHQIATIEGRTEADVLTRITPPHGWTVREDRAYCPAHESVGRRRVA